MPLDGMDTPGVARRVARWMARRGAYRTVFGSSQGRIVLGELLRLGGLLRPSFVRGEDPDGREMAFNEGKRFMALHLVRMMNLSPEQARQLAQEQAEQGEDT